MVNIFLLIAIGVMLSSNAAQADGIVPDMRDPKLPAIKSIRIRENAARSPAASGSEEQCGRFVLTKGEVKDYLLAAREVTQDDYLHMLDWSPCYASGDVLFENGMTGVWGIQQLRAGSLSLSSGRKIYLYCPDCRARSFEPTDKRLPTNAMLPKDVEAFVSRREGCDHFRGEIPEPNQRERVREVQREIRRLCTGTDKQLARLKKKYASEPQIMATMNEFEPVASSK